MPAGMETGDGGTGDAKGPGKAQAKKESKHMINQPLNNLENKKTKNKNNKNNKRITHEKSP